MPQNGSTIDVPLTLGLCRPGFRGTIVAIEAGASAGGVPPEELERRLLEIGMVEGARVELRHQGLFRRDPIAVRINGTATFALRRQDAAAVIVLADAGL